MRAGGLNKVVEIWRRSVAKSSFGAITEEWQLSRKARANIRRVSGGAELDAHEDFGAVVVTLELHAMQKVELTDRFKFEDSTWRVLDTYTIDHPSKRVVKVERINE